MEADLINLTDIFCGIEISRADGTFTASDGRRLPVFQNYAERVRGWKATTNAAAKRPGSEAQRRYELRKQSIISDARLASELLPKGPPWRILEIGAGLAMHSIIWSLETRSDVFAIDATPWYAPDSTSREDHRRAFVQILDAAGLNGFVKLPPLDAYSRAGIRYMRMDARDLEFSNGTFDVVISHNAFMELHGIEKVLDGIRRVLRNGGLLFATWDYYYHWLGAHRKGAIDIPWGHALLSREDYLRFLRGNLDRKKAKIAELYTKSLNRFRMDEWKRIFDSRFEMLRWIPNRDSAADRLRPTWIDGVVPGHLNMDDLLIETISGTFQKAPPEGNWRSQPGNVIF